MTIPNPGQNSACSGPTVDQSFGSYQQHVPMPIQHQMTRHYQPSVVTPNMQTMAMGSPFNSISNGWSPSPAMTWPQMMQYYMPPQANYTYNI